jgi:2'-5' RNA ligase
MVCVPVPGEALLPPINDIREALGQFPFARIHPDSFLHIPVQEIGFMCGEPKRKDDISPDRLDEFLDMAGRALRDFPRFPVTLGPVNSFADAAFLDVHDDGWLSRIQGRLIELMAVSPSTRYPYLPHVTIAHYDRTAPLDNLPGVLAEWRDTQLGSFVITEISVVSLDTQETFPPFVPIHSFPLGMTRATGSIPVRPDPSQA